MTLWSWVNFRFIWESFSRSVDSLNQIVSSWFLILEKRWIDETFWQIAGEHFETFLLLASHCLLRLPPSSSHLCASVLIPWHKSVWLVANYAVGLLNVMTPFDGCGDEIKLIELAHSIVQFNGVVERFEWHFCSLDSITVFIIFLTCSARFSTRDEAVTALNQKRFRFYCRYNLRILWNIVEYNISDRIWSVSQNIAESQAASERSPLTSRYYPTVAFNFEIWSNLLKFCNVHLLHHLSPLE